MVSSSKYFLITWIIKRWNYNVTQNLVQAEGPNVSKDRIHAIHLQPLSISNETSK